LYRETACYFCVFLVEWRTHEARYSERREKLRETEKEKEERKEQAAILYVRALAQQREIKHRGVTKTVETLSLQCKSENEDVLYTDNVTITHLRARRSFAEQIVNYSRHCPLSSSSNS
jgi:hypothetical protein